MFLLDILFPKRCVGCGRIGNYFCFKCSSIVRTIERNEMICPICEKLAIDGFTHPKCRGRYTLDGLVSFFRYDNVVKKAIKLVKYRLVSDLVSEIVNFIPKTSYNFIKQNIITNNSVIVPIPLHPKRFSERGFNQAELFAHQLSIRLNMPMDSKFLQRIKYTKPQVTMRRRVDRLKNMDNVFCIDRFTTYDQRLTVILVDDVFTTGATMRSAANMLKRTGVSKVWSITIAR
jgi:competence protein ComFC